MRKTYLLFEFRKILWSAAAVCCTLLLAVLLLSCGNGDAGSEDTAEVFTITGALVAGGNGGGRSSRTVIPGNITNTVYTIEASSVASSNGRSISGTVESSGGEVGYTLTLTPGTWTVTAKGWDRDPEAEGAKVLYSGGIVALAVPDTTPAQNKNIVLAAIVDGGVGAVDLRITASCQKITRATVTSTPAMAGVSAALDFTSGRTQRITAGAVDAGVYELKLDFFDSNGAKVYSLLDVVNVYSAMTTDTWTADSGEYVSGGAVDITDELVAGGKRTAFTTFYVGNGGNDTTGTGSFFAPYSSFGRAMDDVSANNDGVKKYTIYLLSTLTSSDALQLGNGSRPLDLTVDNASDTNVSIDGGRIKVSRNAAFTVKNVSITGGVEVAAGSNFSIEGNVSIDEVKLAMGAGSSYVSVAGALGSSACVNVSPAVPAAGTVVVKPVAGYTLAENDLAAFHVLPASSKMAVKFGTGGNAAFGVLSKAGAPGGESVTFPDGKFEGTIDADGNITLSGYVSNSGGNVEIPSEVVIDGVHHPVTVIGADVFKNSTANINGVKVPSSVTRIEDGAFNGLTDVANVELHDGLTYIGDNVFAGCTNLHSLNIPGTVTHIGKYAFQDCTGLSNISIPDSVKDDMGGYVFKGCTSLQTVKLPSSSTIIPQGAFDGCTMLTNIQLPNVTTIEKYAFKGCAALGSVNLPASMDGGTIGEYAFEGCKNMNFSINGITSMTIGTDAFKGCTNIQQNDKNRLIAMGYSGSF